MGLSYKEWKKRNELLDVLKEFGITEDDLKCLHDSLIKVKNNETVNKPILSEKEKQSIEQKYKNMLNTPEKIFEMFAGDVEEFYPDGKPTETSGNNKL